MCGIRPPSACPCCSPKGVRREVRRRRADDDGCVRLGELRRRADPVVVTGEDALRITIPAAPLEEVAPPGAVEQRIPCITRDGDPAGDEALALAQCIFQPCDPVARAPLNVRLGHRQRHPESLGIVTGHRRQPPWRETWRAPHRAALQELLFIERIIVSAALIEGRRILDVPLEVAGVEAVLDEIIKQRVLRRHAPEEQLIEEEPPVLERLRESPRLEIPRAVILEGVDVEDEGGRVRGLQRADHLRGCARRVPELGHV